MEELKKYTVVLTDQAIGDLRNKGEYIQRAYLDRSLAREWYHRLRDELEKELSYLPYKYPLYNIKEALRDMGVHIMAVRNDLVLYEIDEDAGVVRVLNVFTRGTDLTRE